MLKTVHIIMDGPTDDRHICAVFSSLEEAEAALCYADEEATIETFQVDAALPAGPPGMSLWCVTKDPSWSAVRLSAFRFPAEEQVQQDEDGYHVDVWTTDQEQALRLGAERIERFKGGPGH